MGQSAWIMLGDHVCDKGSEGVKKFEIFMDVIDGSPLLLSSFGPSAKRNIFVHLSHR